MKTKPATKRQAAYLNELIYRLANDELASKILDKAFAEIVHLDGGWDFYNLAICRLEQAIEAIPICLYASEYEEIIKSQELMDEQSVL